MSCNAAFAEPYLARAVKAALPSVPAAAVAAVLERSGDELDYLEAKLAFDALVDPALNAGSAAYEVERLAAEARSLAAGNNAEPARIAVVRRVLYEAGPWNRHRPFAYDHSDPDGRVLRNALLANYLVTGLGQCVSMPVLLLIVAERLGLDVALAFAPEHLFVRHRLSDGRVANIEATSGGLPTREQWYRRNFRMSERSIESGLYLRSLRRREAVVAMAGVVLSHLNNSRRYADAAAVATVLLRHSPRDLAAMLTLASACAQLRLGEFESGYASPLLIPLSLRPRYLELAERNRALFAAAEAMGWEEPA